MTETTASGVDLARAAYRAARAAAKAAPQPKRRTGAAAPRRPRGAGRDPLSFGDAISRMVVERGWELAAAGGSVLDQWPSIAPHLVGKVAAVGYDPETRTLQLLPSVSVSAYATQLNLYQRDIVAKINEVIGSDTVRTLKVLRPAVLTGPQSPNAAAFDAPAESLSAEPASDGPAAANRSESPVGYRAALAAHRATWTSSRSVDPQVSVAAQRQVRERIREPEERFGDGLSEVGRVRARSTTEGRARSSDAARARALKKLAEERAGRHRGLVPGRS